MRHLISYQIILFYAVMLVFLNGCQKEKSSGHSSPENQSGKKVNAWLDSNISGNTLRNERIKALKDNLDISKLSVEDLDQGEKMIIVPLKRGFVSNINKETDPINNLLLFVDKNGSIRKGNIVQYIPDTGGSHSSVPANTFYAIFNDKPVEASGRYTYLSIFDKFQYEMQYQNGSVLSFGIMKSKDKEPGGSDRENQLCIDWYLITTYYYADGTTHTDEEFIGTSCYGSCLPGELCDELDPTEVGGNGGSDGIVDVSKAVNWVVAESEGLTWHVKSYETLYGIKIPNEQSKFTNITHVTSTLFNTLGSGTTAIWQQLNAVAGLDDEYSGKVTIDGKVTLPGRGDRPIYGIRYWYAPSQFP